LSLIDALRRTKLKPLTLLLVLAGLLGIAYVGLGASLLRQQWDQDNLSSQVNLAEGVLAAAGGPQQALQDLEARLTAAKQELALAQSAYPSELDSSVVMEMVLAHASENQVRVLRAESQPPTVQSDETSTHTVLSITFDAEGGLGQLIAFVAAVESEAKSASGIGALSIEESGQKYILNLEVLAYARSATDEAAVPETPEDSSGPATEAAGDGQQASNE